MLRKYIINEKFTFHSRKFALCQRQKKSHEYSAIALFCLLLLEHHVLGNDLPGGDMLYGTVVATDYDTLIAQRLFPQHSLFRQFEAVFQFLCEVLYFFI